MRAPTAGIAVVLTLASQVDAFAHQTQTLTRLLSDVQGKEVAEETALGIAQLATSGVRSVVARDAVTVIPVQAAEIAKVLARRLFTDIDQQAAWETAEAYMTMYHRSAAALPDRASREEFRAALVAHYPFHPTFIEFLNQKLATMETFQGTRGVLRVLALAVRSLWQAHQDIPMIHTCHLNLRDARIVSELIGRTGSNDLLPVLNTDIGSADTATLNTGRSRAELIDRKNPHPAGFPLHEYTWKTVFLHSLVGRGEGLGSPLFGITERDALFEVAFPGMTPPQAETALQAIEDSGDGAFYLRLHQGRYYASLDPSETRALSSIRGAVVQEQVLELLAATARKVVQASAGPFDVSPDVAAPEDIPDKTRRPVLALVALDADQIDAEACITTVGPNRPREHQNCVFLLVPETVHVKGETWSEDRVMHSREMQHRLEEMARDVLARRKLKAQPENYGISAARLTEKEFDTRLKEREQALVTVVTQAYNALWFPSVAGQVTCLEIKAASGESGAAVIEQIRGALQKQGELITAEQASTQETVLSLGKLFFEMSQTPTLDEMRQHFACHRRWPVLEQSTLLDHIVRAGVARGVWCLFRMGSAENVKPQAFFSRDTGELPLELDLDTPGWSLVTPQGANQRGWTGPVQVDPARIERWVASAIAEEETMYVTSLVQKLAEQHGDVPENAILEAVEKLRQADRLLTYSGQCEQQDRPVDLIHGPGALLRPVHKSDVIVAPAAAVKRGWISAQSRRFSLSGRQGAQTLLPLLPRLGSFYTRGARSPIAVLDLVDLAIRGGGRLRVSLENVPPEAMQQLGEFFETLATVIQPGDAAEADLVIDDPDDQCLLIQSLQHQEGRS
jgi:uncharacterized protein DUF499